MFAFLARILHLILNLEKKVVVVMVVRSMLPELAERAGGAVFRMGVVELTDRLVQVTVGGMWVRVENQPQMKI